MDIIYSLRKGRALSAHIFLLAFTSLPNGSDFADLGFAGPLLRINKINKNQKHTLNVDQ